MKNCNWYTFFLFVLVLGSSFSHRNLWAIQETYFQGGKSDISLREDAVIVNDHGFFPKNLVVFKGEKVRLYLTNTSEKTLCFNVPDKNVFHSLKRNALVESEVYFDKSGRYTINCPNFQHQGTIVVLERASEKEEIQRRGLASDKVKIWKPKDEPSEWMEIRREEFVKAHGDIMDMGE